MNFVVAWASGKKEITYRDESGAEIQKKTVVALGEITILGI
jgi:hypothetical protein